MSCIIPPVHPNPLLHNAIIEKLQEDISQCEWIDKVYPLAIPGERQVDDNRILVPVVYGQEQEGKNDYIELFPDGEIRALSFFEFDAGTFVHDHKEDEDSYQVSLIICGNLKRIADRTYDFTDELIADAMKKILAGQFSNYIIQITPSIDRNNIFSKYGYSFEQLKMFMFPYFAFKLTWSMTINSSLGCVPDTSFNQSFSPPCP